MGSKQNKNTVLQQYWEEQHADSGKQPTDAESNYVEWR